MACKMTVACNAQHDTWHSTGTFRSLSGLVQRHELHGSAAVGARMRTKLAKDAPSLAITRLTRRSTIDSSFTISTKTVFTCTKSVHRGAQP